MIDTVTDAIIQDAIVAVGDEMFSAMTRTSMSPIIYETMDFAVGATDAQGNLVAQGNGVTAFLAMLDTAVQATLERYSRDDIRPGDVFITNIPYEGGGSHLSDVVLVHPVFDDDVLIAFTVNKAHWTEVGGAEPGSVSTKSTQIFQEGLQFNFLKLYDAGRLNGTLVEMIRANVRLPDSTLGDMHAGIAAARVGADRLLALARKYGRAALLRAMERALDYGDEMTRVELARLPHGVFEAEDVVEDDGLGSGPLAICVRVTIDDEGITADYTGTDPQTRGPINCSRTGLITGTRCLFKAITNPVIPANGGCFRRLRVVCPENTLLSARSPAPVSLYYESLIAAIDVMWKALAPAMPDRLPAGHQRSVGATFISGLHPVTGRLFVMGEPLVGGWGALSDEDGNNGQFCCGNGETYNIPVELFESRYGLAVRQYAFSNDDGGAGQFRGGKGVVLDYQVTAAEAFLTYAATRTHSRPWAVQGGQPGSNNYALILRRDGTVERQHMCTGVRVERGDVIRIVTATGGGFGDARSRSRERLLHDLRDGYITPEQAQRDYGFDNTLRA